MGDNNNNITKRNAANLVDSKTRFILRYPGSCITFNLVQAKRLKKDGKTISEKWENEDHDNFLIVRLIESNGSPWLVVHHGIYEVIKGPLFVPAQNCSENDTNISILLRDHANRGGSNCIRREFCFQFNSFTEANSFLFSHNSFVANKQKQQEKDCARVAMSSSTKPATTRKQSRIYQKRYAYLSSSSEGEEDLEERKVSSNLPNRNELRRRKRCMDYEGRGPIGRRERKKMKALLENEDDNLASYKAVVSDFWVGDAANKQDDNFENTPTPWGSDDE